MPLSPCSAPGAAVVSQYSQLKFVDSPHSLPLPPSVVECRGGRSGYAVNQHSQLRFNVKVPPRSTHMEANFPPRPSPVVIEKGAAAVQNAQTSVSAVSATAHNVSTVSQTSLQPGSKVLMSDGLALASWLAKRDLERNRLGALAVLNAGSQHSDMEEEEEEEEDGSGSDLLEDGLCQSLGRGQHESMQPFQADLKVESRPTKAMSRNVHFDTSTGLLASNATERRARHSMVGQGNRPASALLDIQRNTYPKSTRNKSSRPPHITAALNGRENAITSREEEREEESVYDAAGLECHRLHKQLLGQLAALEGVLRRTLESGRVEGSDTEGGEIEEEGARRRRARGEEQLVRSSQTVYNLKQQVCVCVCLCGVCVRVCVCVCVCVWCVCVCVCVVCVCVCVCVVCVCVWCVCVCVCVCGVCVCVCGVCVCVCVWCVCVCVWCVCVRGVCLCGVCVWCVCVVCVCVCGVCVWCVCVVSV